MISHIRSWDVTHSTTTLGHVTGCLDSFRNAQQTGTGLLKNYAELHGRTTYNNGICFQSRAVLHFISRFKVSLEDMQIARHEYELDGVVNSA
jgi:hypothetical protein